MTEAEAQKRFDAWHNEKQAKIQAKRDGLDATAEKELKDRLAAERKQSEERRCWLPPPLTRRVEAEAVARGHAKLKLREKKHLAEEAPRCRGHRCRGSTAAGGSTAAEEALLLREAPLREEAPCC